MSDSEVEEGIGLEEGSFEDDEEKEQQAGGADDMDNDAQEEGDEEKDEEEDEEEEGEEENEEEAINLEIGNRIVQDEKTRFQLDLEFVECLAQPYYLHHLYINGYFDRPQFRNYLKYLGYFHKPEYAKHVLWPQALFFLSQLENDSFCERLAEDSFILTLHRIAIVQWRSWRAFLEQDEHGPSAFPVQVASDAQPQSQMESEVS
eukprot:TRINITY_DN1626_c0_g1_i1.p1 TRINITY_DN1626_c0_g1~~TRINITY_DN1626_c0_g1_i1.p1  ORF type:complete len:204 (-),score=73.68 TRINITY_DN1626_c0_g1_i1:76-687(-)